MFCCWEISCWWVVLCRLFCILLVEFLGWLLLYIYLFDGWLCWLDLVLLFWCLVVWWSGCLRCCCWCFVWVLCWLVCGICLLVFCVGGCLVGWGKVCWRGFSLVCNLGCDGRGLFWCGFLDCLLCWWCCSGSWIMLWVCWELCWWCWCWCWDWRFGMRLVGNWYCFCFSVWWLVWLVWGWRCGLGFLFCLGRLCDFVFCVWWVCCWVSCVDWCGLDCLGVWWMRVCLLCISWYVCDWCGNCWWCDVCYWGWLVFFYCWLVVGWCDWCDLDVWI